MSFGAQLRRARERRRLALDELAQRIRIKPELLVDLENDDVRRWPKARVYRHGYLRAYADALGLDSETVLDRFDAEFGDLHPSAFHRRRAPAAKPVPFSIVSRLVFATSILVMLGGVANIFERRWSPVEEVPAIPSQVFESRVSPWIPDIDASLAPGELVPADAEGELRIISSPPSAHVTVNGIGRGATPLRVRYLPPGPYTIRVIHPRRRIIETRVLLSAGQPRQTVRVALPQEPASASTF